MYVDFSAGNKDYKLRLNTRNIVALEKKLGCNPVLAIGDGESIPTITTMVSILHAALQQYHHGISLEDTYEIFDGYLDNHEMSEFLMVILDIYKVSGIIKVDEAEDEAEKN
jgi:hypothetical protein